MKTDKFKEQIAKELRVHDKIIDTYVWGMCYSKLGEPLVVQVRELIRDPVRHKA